MDQMGKNKLLGGMRGVFLVAAELSRRGFIVTPTSRSAIGADLLVTDQDCQRTYSVQVKTNSTKQPDWLLNKRAKDIVSKQYVYVFVDAVDDKDVEMFPVPSKVVAAKMTETVKPNSTWYAFNRERFARRYKDKWEIFGIAAKDFSLIRQALRTQPIDAS